MKILHLVTSLDFGGLERRIEILSKYPSSQNELIFVALGKGGATYDRLITNHSNVHLLNCDPAIFRFKTLLALLKIMLEIKPNIVHCHGCEANFYGVIASRLTLRQLLIAEEIGVPKLSIKAKFIFKLIYSFVNKVICMSPAVLNHLHNEKLVTKNKLVTVYNPVLMQENVNKGVIDISKPLSFVYLGRLEEVKNPLGLLKAFDEFINNGYCAHLTIIGDGSQMAELVAFIANNSLDGTVTLLGFLTHPLAELDKHDVLIQPSHTEGFSLALAEAMSCTLPALCTPSGSATTLIEHNVNGWLLESSETQSIYKGLVKVFENRHKVVEMGVQAREKVIDKHSPQQYAPNLDEFYDRLLK